MIKSILFFQVFGFFLITFPSIFTSSVLAEESDFNNNSEVEIIEDNFVIDGSLIDAIYYAIEYLSALPEDIPLEFPLGTNDPINNRYRELQEMIYPITNYFSS